MKIRIGILGMGGVGSFIATQLLRNADDDIEVICISRGQTKKQLLVHGLTLKTSDEIINVTPHLVSDNPEEIGKLDFLFVTVKSCDLSEALTQYKSCLKQNSLVIPLLNGVNIKELIFKYTQHPVSNIFDGSIYIISNIEEAGVARHLGGPGNIIIGNTYQQDLNWVVDLLQDNGLNISYCENIKEVIWRKFLFVSAVSQVTYNLGVTMGQLRENESSMDMLRVTMSEIVSIANSKNVKLTHQDIENACKMLDNFPFHAKPSLQIDLEKGKIRNEKATLIDYIQEQKLPI